MKVKDLKLILDELDDDMEIVIQKDAEGNGYSPLAGADPDAVYVPETTWYGNVYSLDWTADECCFEEEEWEELKKENGRTLILYPVN